MQSRNPIFRDIEKQPGFAYNEGVNAYQQAAAGTATLDQQTQPTVGCPQRTSDDHRRRRAKTGLAFVALLIGAGIGWVLTRRCPGCRSRR